MLVDLPSVELASAVEAGKTGEPDVPCSRVNTGNALAEAVVTGALIQLAAARRDGHSGRLLDESVLTERAAPTGGLYLGLDRASLATHVHREPHVEKLLVRLSPNHIQIIIWI